MAEQGGGGETGGGGDGHHEGGDREVGVFEQADIHNRIFLEQFPNNCDEYRPDGNYAEGQDEIRLKPVVALSFVEHNLKATQSNADEGKADVIDLDSGTAFFR